ncbi:MAG: deoxyhypusine synthase [Candidatus Auribacterota bacterium]|jgi:deoxyhypusine synthase|uniref:Deoxyhypusine synthase-like protein n=1 Tax=Candidatus Auribacter fodinae TaxID=2093366 RepID=A0A3A4R0D9_9BACT|nr:MAG: deoxyhypusine synthase [Candidatus Auribacter fodinae]
MKKEQYLARTIEHLSLEKFNPVAMIDGMSKMAFQARNLSRAAGIYEQMLRDNGCSVILCLAGSLISAGLKQVIIELVEKNMVDAIVSTGANIVDQDFFEGLGFRHYIGSQFVDDNELRELHIDRIYDTYIDEDDLRVCDDTVGQIANSLETRPYASWEFIHEMGAYLNKNHSDNDSIVLSCYRKGVPIFCPAFSDSSAGFGLVHHQWHAALENRKALSLDSAKDFLDLTRIKLKAGDTGLLMIGGGVPKNFAQDIVVSAEVLGYDVSMHKYAIQITVADERDGALSGSTLKEANSWGKVDSALEQMVYGEATVMFPLLAGYAYHKKAYAQRKENRFADFLLQPITAEEKNKAGIIQ